MPLLVETAKEKVELNGIESRKTRYYKSNCGEYLFEYFTRSGFIDDYRNDTTKFVHKNLLFLSYIGADRENWSVMFEERELFDLFEELLVNPYGVYCHYFKHPIGINPLLLRRADIAMLLANKDELLSKFLPLNALPLKLMAKLTIRRDGLKMDAPGQTLPPYLMDYVTSPEL